MEKWIYEGNEYEFSLTKTDDIRKLIRAQSIMNADSESASYDTARSFCKSVCSFFSILFGAETAEKICSEDRITSCMKAYLAFVKYARAETDRLIKYRDSLCREYGLDCEA